jgi:hypothetical protein
MHAKQNAPDLSLIPEPWEYNPSKWSQRMRVALVALPAFVAAVYMGLYQWRLIPGVWDPVFGESVAQTASISTRDP